MRAREVSVTRLTTNALIHVIRRLTAIKCRVRVLSRARMDMMQLFWTRVAILGTVVLLGSASAQAADLRVLASNGVKAAIEELKPQLEKASGSTLSIDFSTTAALRERIEKGETFDVAILADDAIDALIK